MTTERPDGTQGDLESPKAPAEALRPLIEKGFFYCFDAKAKFRAYYTDREVQAAIDEINKVCAAYAATVEREARIDEIKHTTYLMGDGYYWFNKLPNGDTEIIPQADRLAALQGPLDNNNEGDRS